MILYCEYHPVNYPELKKEKRMYYLQPTKMFDSLLLSSSEMLQLLHHRKSTGCHS
jgi:hypothetical protein